jgi:hypothetical protein
VLSTVSTGRKHEKTKKLDFHMNKTTIKLKSQYIPASYYQDETIKPFSTHSLSRKAAFGAVNGEHRQKAKKEKEVRITNEKQQQSD